MIRRLLLALCGLALCAPLAWAEHATINLRIIRLAPPAGATEDEGSASADQEPPRGGHLPRPLFKVKVNEPLALQFVLTNTYPHGDHKNVIVRYFVVREAKERQKETPSLDEGVVVQGMYKMNFKPKCRVGARVQFTLREPGLYLLRVDTQNTQSDHEHFSAIDIRAE
jgi:hypothetical protein